MLHKNANFWIRLLYRTLDLITFLGLVVLTFFLLFVWRSNTGTVSNLNYYLFWALSFIYSSVLFILIPYSFEGRTIWMIATRVQILIEYSEEGAEKPTKKDFYITYFKRSIFSFFVWFIVIFANLTLIRQSEINDYIKYLNTFYINQKKEDFPKRFLILSKFLQTFISLVFFIHIGDLLAILISKKHKGLIDNLSNSRVVWIKHYKKEDSKNMPTLIPFEAKNEEVNLID